MTDEPLDYLLRILADHSGYLRNPIRHPNLTCAACAAPIKPEYSVCYQCRNHRATPHTADRVGSMIYALEGSQSDRLMYGYKSAAPGPNQQRLINILLAVALSTHMRCAGKLAGRTIERWATIPSLKPDKIGSAHPLRQMLVNFLPTLPEIGIQANPPISNPRGLEPGNYRVTTPVPPSSHVLVIDDTWVSGGHAQSAAMALKTHGAQQVSVLTIARWLRPTDPTTAPFVTSHLAPQTYDPRRCPWTSEICH